MKAIPPLVRASGWSAGDHCIGRLYRRISVLNITPRQPVMTDSITAARMRFHFYQRTFSQSCDADWNGVENKNSTV